MVGHTRTFLHAKRPVLRRLLLSAVREIPGALDMRVDAYYVSFFSHSFGGEPINNPVVAAAASPSRLSFNGNSDSVSWLSTGGCLANPVTRSQLPPPRRYQALFEERLANLLGTHPDVRPPSVQTPRLPRLSAVFIVAIAGDVIAPSRSKPST